MSRSDRPEHPDDHQRFSLNEDWIATLLGLLIFGACMAGLIAPGLLP